MNADPSSASALRRTLVLAAASALVVAFGLVRTKVVALELGPRGVGTLALLLSLASFLSVVFQFGFGATSIRQIAFLDGRGTLDQRDELRSALYSAMLWLAVAGAILVLIAARPLAVEVLGDGRLEDEVRLSSLIVLASVSSAAAIADLYGLRRAKALAGLQSAAAAAATAIVVAAAVAEAALLETALVASAIVSASAALLYSRCLPKRPRIRLRRVLSVMGETWKLSVVFLANAVITAASMLLVRVLIDNELGRAATGEFQAAFLVSATLVGFLITALESDYLPRLSALADRPAAMNQEANDQLRLMLLLATPIIVVLIASAPTVVQILYSNRFVEAVALLRIMLLGEFAHVAATAVGLILVGRASLGRHLVIQVASNAVLLGSLAALSSLGLTAAALAYASANVVGLGLSLLLVRRSSGFRPSGSSVTLLGVGAVASLAVFALTSLGTVGAVLAVVAAACVVGASVVALAPLLKLRMGE